MKNLIGNLFFWWMIGMMLMLGYGFIKMIFSAKKELDYDRQ